MQKLSVKNWLLVVCGSALPAYLALLIVWFSYRLFTSWFVYPCLSSICTEEVKNDKSKLEVISKRIIEDAKKKGDPNKIDPKLKEQLKNEIRNSLKKYKSDIPMVLQENLVDSMLKEFFKGIAYETGASVVELVKWTFSRLFDWIFSPTPTPTCPACPACPACPTPTCPTPICPTHSPSFSGEVRFEFNEDKVPTAGLITIGQAIEFASQNKSGKVFISCYADRSGKDLTNYALSQRRCEAVRNILVDRKIPKDRIKICSLGEYQHPFHTNDEVREPENRRAEIEVADEPKSPCPTNGGWH